MDLSSGWSECVSDVVRGAAPPEVTGHPHPTPIFGPCTHRFEVAAAIAAEAERGARIARSEKARAEAEAAAARAGEKRRDESLAALRGSTDPGELVAALRAGEGLVPAGEVKAAWLRFLEAASPAPQEEMLTLEGRGTVLGFFLSRGTYTSQWGKWVELKREPVFRASGAGREVTAAYADVPGSVQEGFDVWVDAAGTLWSDGRSGPPARLAVGADAPRTTRRLVLGHGERLRLRRRKEEWLGWEIRVPGAQGAWGYAAGDAEYARAMAAAIGSHAPA